MFITKFEKDYNSQIDYQFINAFPKTITSIPVSYGEADLLKVTVSFNYDRYIMNPKGYLKHSNTSFFSDIIRKSAPSYTSSSINEVKQDKKEVNNNNDRFGYSVEEYNQKVMEGLNDIDEGRDRN